MFIITNNCNPEYFNQNAIIDNLRTEVLSMNERRLIYRRLINHLAYLSMKVIFLFFSGFISPGVVQLMNVFDNRLN
jgi:hypothetical protein